MKEFVYRKGGFIGLLKRGYVWVDDFNFKGRKRKKLLAKREKEKVILCWDQWK